jgi:hypothetical protein
MNYNDVLNQLNDLPITFQHGGIIYPSIIAAIASALARNTTSADAVIGNINLPTAQWGWLNSIGELYGIIRTQYEIDPTYRNRIQQTLVAPHGTPEAIQDFIKLITGITTVVTENFTNCSYQINFLAPVSVNTIQQVVIAINWVRPAGVPFLPIYRVSGGLFLNTCNFLGVKRVTGSYLAQPTVIANVSIGPSTDNLVSQLPTLYLTDQYITGQFPMPNQV